MSTAATPVFDICGPLPTGTTVLEASAGTGKTFTIAALATRYVAEGLAELPELLLVTFGRAATSELRDRVRASLVTAERALADPSTRTSDDSLLRHLAAVDDRELAVRRARLTRALAEFDAATIATTHGFCQAMLGSLGVAGDVEAGAVLVPDIADLLAEVVDDLYLQRYAHSPAPTLSVADARTVARAAVSDHAATLEPADAAPDTAAGHRYAFAAAVRAEIAARKRARRLLDYDDLLVLLRSALADPEHGAAAAERIRSRYRIVMVDEFQDTDPVQWDILRTAFHGHRTLVLIGDPKQAIYAFRGADVVTYLDARGEARTTATLGRNWRSDRPLLHGLERVFAEAALGEPRIVVRPVAAEHTDRRLDGGAPLRMRHVPRAALGAVGVKNPPVGELRRLVAEDVAADIVRSLGTTRVRRDAGPHGGSGTNMLLDGGSSDVATEGPGAQVTPDGRGGDVTPDGREEDAGGWRPLQPGDIAVLTGRNVDATAVREALAAVGVPAVESGVTSVFATPAAQHWLSLLTAVAQPGHAGRTAAVALTPFLGWDAHRLATAAGADRDALADRVRLWAGVLAERGVAALMEAAAAAGLTERLMRTTTGERTLTDLRHVGQALHAAAVSGSLGTAALKDWLRRRMDEAGRDYAEERSRRLETDAATVQVITVHASKGLEFPVVYVPFAWDRYAPPKPDVLSYHDPTGDRRLHVGGPSDGTYGPALALHGAEERGEDLRLLYVALTRASSQVVVWWAPSYNSPNGPLTRVLFGGHGPGQEPPEKVAPVKDDVTSAALAALAAGSDGTIAHETVGAGGTEHRWAPGRRAEPELAVGVFDRRLDTGWRRTSYTGLTAAAHAEPGGVGSEPETTGVEDEAEVLVGDAGGQPGSLERRLRELPSPMSHLPGGTGFGTLVHEVLERADAGAADLRAELLRRCRDAGPSRAGVDAEDLATALVPVLTTPLGGLAGGRTLRDIPGADKLAEMEFELPLAGGDLAAGSWRHGATLTSVAGLLRTELALDDVFAGYADRLTDARLGDERMRGYLTGSLDGVLRVRDGSGVRYLVVDYKTNRLAPPTEPVTAWHYRPEAMAEAMMAAHYPLQLLLYSVALHRFLRWRQPGYEPDRHLGGGLYLFVRGMSGPETPVVDGSPCGVLGWRPPTSLVVRLSALLDGQRA